MAHGRIQGVAREALALISPQRRRIALQHLQREFAGPALARNGFDQRQHLLGHALAETTTRYAHLSDEIVADAAERVSGSIARLIGVGQ